MGDRQSKKDQLKKQSARAAQKADELLADDLETLRNLTNVNLEDLRPKIHDKETYDKLMAIVRESTQNNESIAELKDRIAKLGELGASVVKEIVALRK